MTVPQIHRFRIGDFDATVVSDGRLHLPAPRRIFRDLPDALLERTLAEAGLPTDAMLLEQNCLVLEAEGRRVLFDTGMGSSRMFGADAGRLRDNLLAAGISPGSIDALVFTHAHSDHCWGTILPDGSPSFPNATIYIADAELAFWERQPRGGIDADGVRRQLRPLADRTKRFAGDETILPGIRALATPGHTPGHISYSITSAGAECLVLGDVACFAPLSFAFPHAHCAFDIDRPAAAQTRIRMLGQLAERDTLVLGYHQPWPGLFRLAPAGAGFRCLPEPAPIAVLEGNGDAGR